MLFCFCLLCTSIIVSYGQASLNMDRIGQWNTIGANTYIDDGSNYNDIWGYATPSGEEYAIIGNKDSILVVDVSIPSVPVRKFGMLGGSTVNWRDFKTHKDHAYGVCDNCTEGLHIIDLSNLPTSASHALTTTAFFQKSHNIYIEEATDRLYAAGVTGATDLTVLDITNPANPTLLKHIDFNTIILDGENYYVHDVFVRNNIAYCSHGSTGYFVWDLSDLNNITLLGKITELVYRYNHSSWITEDNAYAIYAEEVPTGNPMVVVDLANLGTGTDLTKVTTFQDPLESSGLPTPHNPFIKGDTLFISYYEDGVKAYDISDPTNPSLIAYYDTYPDNVGSYNGYKGCWGVYPYLPSGHILASDRTYGLQVLKIPPPLICDDVFKNYSFSQFFNYNIFENLQMYMTATGTLNPSSDLHVRASNYLELKPNFECKLGSEVHLEIGSCQ